MLKYWIVGITAFFLFLGPLCNAQTQQKKQMLNDLDFITNLFEISYAPLIWKSEEFGWDLDAERIKAKRMVSEDPLLKQKAFQRIIKDFCLSTKDYHVVPDFYSTEYSSLPFNIKSADGKYFVTFVDLEAFEQDSSSLSVGDQLLFFQGRPIEEAVNEFRIKEIGNNFIGTDQALAEFYFTSRMGNLGHDIPKGKAEIIFYQASTKEKKTVSLDWDYYVEKIIGTDASLLAKSLTRIPQRLKKDSWQKVFMTPHCIRKKVHRASNEDAAQLFGARKSFVPELGDILWESDKGNEFHAYLFLMENDLVGAYVRIPSYYVDGDKAAMAFSDIIELFEEVSDVLVIDQLNNGGGVVLYLYALLSMLTDKELELPQHRMILTQEDLYLAVNRLSTLEHVKNDRGARKKFGDTLDGAIVNYQLIKDLQNSYQFIIDQWNQGKLLTDYSYLYGMEKISPHPEVRYTKPILVLVNSLNFSAADFFPAIMQDNKRAKIMGTRTAGAGGYIERISFPNLNGIEGIDITASFSLRTNGMPIENYGVIPDITCEITQKDLQNNYSEYKQNILKELKHLNESPQNNE